MDSPELIFTWIPLDTTVMNGVVDGENHLTGRQFADLAWEMVPRKWRTAVTLRLKSPSAMWSLWVFWDEGMSSLKAWYINIDAPFKRTRLGFDTWDMFLDIVVAPDRKSWRYKDEDEFADAISAARPGARRDILASYIKRLEKLEGIADSFKGVSKAFALQAGREIRIMVESETISDEEAVWLSKDIAKRIENELQYPGQIKVTVIRETRAVDYAR